MAKTSSNKYIKGVEVAMPETNENDVQVVQNGLSKSIFFNILQKHGVLLNEYEKALIATVFGMKL